MKGIRAAVRYAKALRQLAQEKNLLDTVVADVKLVHNTITESRDLTLLLESPLVNEAKKKEVLAAIFSKSISELTMNFITQVVSQRRENILEAICNDFINQYNAIKNIAKVNVTTSIPLTDEVRQELIKKISTQYNLSEVELEEKVDTDLIGGMVLRIGDKQLDASIRRQLNDIKQELVHA